MLKNLLNKRNLVLALILGFTSALALPDTASAQRRRGGSSRRSAPRPQRRVTPRPSTPKPDNVRRSTPRPNRNDNKATRNTPRPNRNSARSGGSSRPKNATKSSATGNSKADKAAYAKAKKGGKAFKGREQATADFKKKHGKQYGSTYATKPGTRPQHIPQTTMVGGSSVNITFMNHGGVGGYYYMNSLGRYTMYDAFADAAMHGYFAGRMRHQGYYYGPAPGGWGFLAYFLTIMGVIVILVIGGVVLSRYS